MTSIPEADDATVREIESLARAARAMQPNVLPDALWQTVLDLPTWWLVAERTSDGISPMVSPIEGTTAMFAFTTSARARTFLAGAGIDPSQAGPLEPVAVAPAYVVDRSQIYAQVGAGILLFDCNDVGFFTPVGKLHDLWRRLRGDWVTRTEEDIPEPRFLTD